MAEMVGVGVARSWAARLAVWTAVAVGAEEFGTCKSSLEWEEVCVQLVPSQEDTPPMAAASLEQVTAS